MLSAVFEEEKKFNGGMNTVNEIRKWSQGGIVLALSVLVSLSLLCGVISFIMQVVSIGFDVAMSGNILGILVGFIACVGFWRAYFSGKNKSGKYSSGGARMLRVVLVIYEILTFVLCTLLIVLMLGMILMTVTTIQGMSEIFGKIYVEFIAVMYEQIGFDIFGVLGLQGITLYIVLLVAAIIAFVVLIFFFRFARRFAGTAIKRLDGVSNEYKSAMPAAVFFFIFGIISLVAVILPLVSPGADLALIGAIKWISIISGVATGLTFLFAGLLAVSFNGAQKRAMK